MATTKTDDTTKLKKMEEENKNLKKELKASDKKILESEKKIDDLSKKFEEMMEKFNSIPNEPKTQTNPSNKNIKLTSLIPNTLVLNTREDSKGKKCIFNKFGETKQVRFSDMLNILSLNNNLSRFENGEVIINDKTDAIDLGVEYLYEDSFKRKEIEQIIKLERENDFDIILGMSEEARDNIINLIAINIAKGEKYDFNIIQKFEELGYDITAKSKIEKAFMEASQEDDK